MTLERKRPHSHLKYIKHLQQPTAIQRVSGYQPPRRHSKSRLAENATRPASQRFVLLLQFFEVTGRNCAAACPKKLMPCQEEQDRFYDLLLAAVASLSMGCARLASRDRRCPGPPFIGGWYIIGRRTGAARNTNPG